MDALTHAGKEGFDFVSGYTLESDGRRRKSALKALVEEGYATFHPEKDGYVVATTKAYDEVTESVPTLWDVFKEQKGWTPATWRYLTPGERKHVVIHATEYERWIIDRRDGYGAFGKAVQITGWTHEAWEQAHKTWNEKHGNGKGYVPTGSTVVIIVTKDIRTEAIKCNRRCEIERFSIQNLQWGLVESGLMDEQTAKAVWTGTGGFGPSYSLGSKVDEWREHITKAEANALQDIERAMAALKALKVLREMGDEGWEKLHAKLAEGYDVHWAKKESE
jgi:hypothetical protein